MNSGHVLSFKHQLFLTKTITVTLPKWCTRGFPVRASFHLSRIAASALTGPPAPRLNAEKNIQVHVVSNRLMYG